MDRHDAAATLVQDAVNPTAGASTSFPPGSPAQTAGVARNRRSPPPGPDGPPPLQAKASLLPTPSPPPEAVAGLAEVTSLVGRLSLLNVAELTELRGRLRRELLEVAGVGLPDREAVGAPAPADAVGVDEADEDLIDRQVLRVVGLSLGLGEAMARVRERQDRDFLKACALAEGVDTLCAPAQRPRRRKALA